MCELVHLLTIVVGVCLRVDYVLLWRFEFLLILFCCMDFGVIEGGCFNIARCCFGGLSCLLRRCFVVQCCR